MLKFDEHNFNKHTEEGMDLLEKSVREHNFGRSILVDKDNNIIAGNGIVETAKKLDKTKIKVVETTGEELVVVKRTDVDINSKAGREMALADNATASNNLSWDKSTLAQVAQEFEIDVEDWGCPDFEEWGNLGISDNAQEPELNAPLRFSVQIPFELKDKEDEIKECVVSALADYKDVKIK